MVNGSKVAVDATKNHIEEMIKRNEEERKKLFEMLALVTAVGATI